MSFGNTVWRSDTLRSKKVLGYVHVVLTFPYDATPQKAWDTTQSKIYSYHWGESTRSIGEIIRQHATANRKQFRILFHDDRRRGGRPHIHLFYWHYRQCEASTAIQQCSEGGSIRLGLRWSKVVDPVELRKYLSEAAGRFILSDEERFCRYRGVSYREATDLHSVHEAVSWDPQEAEGCFGEEYSSDQELDNSHQNTGASRYVGERAQGLSGNEDECSTTDVQSPGRSRLLGSVLYQLQKAISQIQPVDAGHFRRVCASTSRQELREFYIKFMHSKDFDRKVSKQITFEQSRIQNLTWLQCINSLDIIGRKQSHGPFVDRNKSVKWIEMILHHNQIDVKYFVRLLWNVMNRNNGKKNTILFLGEPNCGKSLIMTSIAESLIYYFTNTKSDAGRDRFYLQEMNSVRCAFFDEFILTDGMQPEFLKVCQGLENSTDVKFGSKESIPKTPIMMAGNMHPSMGLSREARGAFMRAFNERCTTFNLKSFEELKNLPENKLSPMAWRILIYKHIPQFEIDRSLNTGGGAMVTETESSEDCLNVHDKSKCPSKRRRNASVDSPGPSARNSMERSGTKVLRLEESIQTDIRDFGDRDLPQDAVCPIQMQDGNSGFDRLSDVATITDAESTTGNADGAAKGFERSSGNSLNTPEYTGCPLDAYGELITFDPAIEYD